MPFPLTGANSTRAKAFNLRLVLETIRREKRVSRAGIARSTTLSAPTVSNIVSELIDEGFVMEAGRQRAGRGSPSIALELNADRAVSIGLDLGRSHLTGVLVDLGGTLRERIHHELDYPSPDAAIDRMVDTVAALMDRAALPDDRLWGVGVGVPGPLHAPTEAMPGGSTSPDAFPGWDHVPVADRLADRLAKPVRLENNATAAAIGERWYGSGQDVAHFAYVYFGVGLGGGLIVNGAPFTGSSGNAGELGYLFPLLRGAPAATPSQAAASSAASSASAASPPPDSLPPDSRHSADAQPSPPDALHGTTPFHLPGLIGAMRTAGANVQGLPSLAPLFDDEHPVLIAWLHRAARHLAPLLAAVCYLFDPQAIFFGGRLPIPLLRFIVEALPGLLDPLQIPGKDHRPRLSLGDAGREAAALGAATLPVYESFVPAPELMLKPSSSSTKAPFSS